MKKILLILALLAMVAVFGSCKKEIPGCIDIAADNYNSAATDNDGSCEYSGDFVFWINQPLDYVDVTMNGVTKTITSYYPSGGVDCSSPGCAIFHLPTGTYNYYAEEQGAIIDYWSGSITVEKNICKSLLLVD